MTRTYKNYIWANPNSRRISRAGLHTAMKAVDEMQDEDFFVRPRELKMSNPRTYLNRNHDRSVSAYQPWLNDLIWATEPTDYRVTLSETLTKYLNRK